jgi:hypothetical protein
MTRDEAREASKVLQHYADGGDVEYRSSLADGWWPANAPVFDFARRQYRIKPKPAEGWVIIDSDGAIRGDHPRARLFATREAAEEFAGGLVALDASGQPYRIVRMIEATP